MVLYLLYLDFTLSGLFSELDCRPDLGIINYGVSMTTLEDVFLRLEAEAEVDQAGETSFLSFCTKQGSTFTCAGAPNLLGAPHYILEHQKTLYILFIEIRPT